jgi:hypothetical protein
MGFHTLSEMGIRHWRIHKAGHSKNVRSLPCGGTGPQGMSVIVKLADQYTPERLEDACQAALTRLPNPRYKNIRLILESGQDKKAAEASHSSTKVSSSDKYAIVRGAAYYGGGNYEE